MVVVFAVKYKFMTLWLNEIPLLPLDSSIQSSTF